MQIKFLKVKVFFNFPIPYRFTELKSVQCAVAGRLLFMRFRAITGDAMGMNMVSKVRILLTDLLLNLTLPLIGVFHMARSEVWSHKL